MINVHAPRSPFSASAAEGLAFRAKGLTKTYGPNTVIEDIAFDIPDNQVVSLVGENGAGKSTIFNIISGLVKSDRGAMTLYGRDYAPKGYAEAVRLGVSRVFQEQALIPNIPVYENLLLGQDGRFLKLRQIVDRTAMIPPPSTSLMRRGSTWMSAAAPATTISRHVSRSKSRGPVSRRHSSAER